MSLFWLHNKRRRILSFSWNMCELCNLNPDIKTSKKHCTQYLEKNVKPNSFLSFGDLFWKLPAVQLKRTQQFSKMSPDPKCLLYANPGEYFFSFSLGCHFYKKKSFGTENGRNFYSTISGISQFWVFALK